MGAYDIFLSYDYNNRDLVEKLRERLKKSGFAVFDPSVELVNPEMDQEELEEGFRKALSESRHILLVLTPESVRSPGVNFELGAALFLEKDLIPIISKELTTSDIPSPLRRYRYLQIEDDIEETARKIVAELDLRENENSGS